MEHIGLPSRDPVALKNWYVNTLGAKVFYAEEKARPAFFVALPGGLLIEIYHTNVAVPETSNNAVAGWRHLALRVTSIERARDELLARGVKFEEPIKAAGGGGRVLFFRDPEGNLLHLVERPAGTVFNP